MKVNQNRDERGLTLTEREILRVLKESGGRRCVPDLEVVRHVWGYPELDLAAMVTLRRHVSNINHKYPGAIVRVKDRGYRLDESVHSLAEVAS